MVPRQAASDFVGYLAVMAQILVAEDDTQLRNFLVRMLQRAGYRVRAAENGMEAVAMLGNMKVDLLLADVTMPGLDGFELAKQCTRHNPDVQIMFITGFAAVSLKRNRPARGNSATRSAGAANAGTANGSASSSNGTSTNGGNTTASRNTATGHTTSGHAASSHAGGGHSSDDANTPILSKPFHLNSLIQEVGRLLYA